MESKSQEKADLLQKELADYALFPEMNPGPVIRLDKSGKILLANKAARNLFGEDKILRGNWLKICPGLDEEMWQQIIKSKESLSIETDIAQKCITFSYVSNEDKSLVFAFGTDITELRSIEKKLADYARFPEMNPGPVLRLDNSGKILLANKTARNLFGEDKILRGNWLKICPGLDEEMWQQIIESKEPLSNETDIDQKCIMFSYVKPEDKGLVFAFGTDITELRKVEKQLADYARFPNMNPAPVLRFDLEGTILLSNAAALQVFGFDLEGKCWRDVCPGLKKDAIWKLICEATVEPYNIEVHIGKKDFMFSHRRDLQSNLLFAYGADITQSKKTEIALRQSEKMATLGTLAAGVAHELNNPAAAMSRSSEQMNGAFTLLEKSHIQLSKINFSNEALDVLHVIEQRSKQFAINPKDFNAIVRSDKETEIEDWFLDRNLDNACEFAPYLVELGIDTKTLTEYYSLFPDDSFFIVLQWAASVFQVYSLLNEIKQGSTRISVIVSALRSYSYLGQAPFQLINVQEGIDNTLVILHHKLKSGITVTRDYGNDIPLISAYGSELNQVWTNILDNALDVLNGKGEIIIRSIKEDSNVIIEILDNGPGIPNEIQSRIFDPFFTTKEPGKGTGLGLSTSYNIIVEKHKGKISVNSQPGKTCFSVVLPIQGDKN